MRVSPDFFTTLGVGPVMGRSFTEAEDDHVRSRTTERPS